MAKDWYKRNPTYAKQKAAQWRKDNPGRLRAYKIANRRRYYIKEVARKYKVHLEWFDVQLKAQAGRCAICRTPLEWTARANTPHVDHCHKTGKVRGIVCMRCNSAIGFCEDNVSLLLSMARYLKCHGSSAKH